ncbi:MAG: DUF3656 domain-containing protein [Bacillota bacterium]|nr:DUF3656 domain-containing protein [Bacillota bacterium]
MAGKLEILAPVGSIESLYPAVRMGADAVYLGAESFSARAAAVNFSFDDLKAAVCYCHNRNVKVYLTLNTVIKDNEMQDAVMLAKTAVEIGIDAIIVQDLGLATLLLQAAPEIRLHGSTQMSVHTPSGAKALYELGFKRVVLARELSKKEIEEIVKSCPIELEVFVHGALCMCVSGQCYFSAMLGSRSGNRGRCAQPCRLPFMAPEGTGYDLSLKDMSHIDYLRELAEIGVVSAKIEGRMKRPEYVALATYACRKSLDDGFVNEKTNNDLEAIFSRSGFTDGYYHGKLGREMFGIRTKENVQAAEPILAEIRQMYKEEPQTIPLDFSIEIFKDKPVLISVSDGEHTVRINGENAQKAINTPITEEKCRQQLKKTGGTPFYLHNLTCKIDDGLTIPLSQLNNIRRNAIEKLTLLRCEREIIDFNMPSFDLETEKPNEKQIKLRARFKNTEIPEEFKEAEMIFVPLFSKSDELIKLIRQGFNVGVEIPRGMFGIEAKILKQLEIVKSSGIKDILASNIGAVHLLKDSGFSIHGGFGLNITNSYALAAYKKMGLCDAEVSFELTLSEITKLRKILPIGVISYGRLPLMLVRNCPSKNASAQCKNCTRISSLTDRKKERFTTICDGISTEILNLVPLIILDKINDSINLDFHTMLIYVENYVENKETLRIFHTKNTFDKQLTRGLYFRGVK